MTIQFLTSWNGMSGIQTLAAPEEARLVAAGLARVYTPYMDGGPSNPEANNLEVGPSGLTKGGAALTAGEIATVNAALGVGGSAANTRFIEDFGSEVGGYWDAAFVAAMTYAGTVGGLELKLQKQEIYRLSGTFPSIPNDGGTAPQAVPIIIKGAGSYWSGRGRPRYGSTVLDIQGVSAYGKITLTGLGLFALRDLTLTDSSASGGALVYTTNATLDIQGCAFMGITAGTSATQDAIILGGPNQVEAGSGVTDGFQGYGTVIQRNYFHNIRRAVYGRAFCNAVSIRDNTIWSTCGAADDTPCIEIDGAPAGGVQVAAGNFITGNLFELVNYAYGIRLVNAQRNYLHNRFYDSTAKTLAAIRLESTAQYNQIDENYTPSGLPLISDASGGRNPVRSLTQGVTGVGMPMDFTDTSYPLRAAKSKFYGGVDSVIVQSDAAVADGIVLFRVKRSAAETVDPGIDVLSISNRGELEFASAKFSLRGNQWISTFNAGVGQNMKWDTGTGGNYSDIKSYAIRHYDHTNALIATMSSAATGWNIARPLTWRPAASVTPATNGELTFEATSNTSVTVKLKGSDGTVRSAVLTLA